MPVPLLCLGFSGLQNGKKNTFFLKLPTYGILLWQPVLRYFWNSKQSFWDTWVPVQTHGFIPEHRNLNELQL